MSTAGLKPFIGQPIVPPAAAPPAPAPAPAAAPPSQSTQSAEGAQSTQSPEDGPQKRLSQGTFGHGANVAIAEPEPVDEERLQQAIERLERRIKDEGALVKRELREDIRREVSRLEGKVDKIDKSMQNQFSSVQTKLVTMQTDMHEMETKLVTRVKTLEQDMDTGFTEIDQRFDGVDARFDGVDARFDTADARFDAIDTRFTGLEDDMNARFNEMDARFNDMDARFTSVDTRFTKLEGDMNARFTKLEDSMQKIMHLLIQNQAHAPTQLPPAIVAHPPSSDGHDTDNVAGPSSAPAPGRKVVKSKSSNISLAAAKDLARSIHHNAAQLIHKLSKEKLAPE